MAGASVASPAIAPRDAELCDGYRVLGLLSRTKALDTYDVWSEERGVRCVAKVMRPDRAEDPKVVRHLHREADLLLSFTHPNIVRAYELVPEPQALILETLSGDTLDSLVRTARRPLPARDLAYLAAQLGAAIRYVHGRGVLHLDVKPSNVIAQCGQAKLLDFSLARAPGRIPADVGTPGFLAPEQARGGDAGAAADVWGLGVTVFQAATGRMAFPWGDDPRERPMLHRRAEPVGAHRRLPRPLAELVDACLEPDPAKRPTVPEFLAVVHSLVDVAPARP